MSAEFESGIFVRKEAWHKQGKVLEYYPDTIEAFRESGLNWGVTKRRLVLKGHDGFGDEPTNYYAIVRNTDNRQLGYVGERYEPYQNAAAFKWLEPLVDSGLWKIETAGSLRNGECCWVLLRQGEVEIIPNDLLKEYLLFTWSHDGGTPNILQPTFIRVVCNNTLQDSLRQGNFARVIHTNGIHGKMDFVQQLFSKSEDAFATQIEVFRRLLDKTLTSGMIEQLCEEFYGLSPEEREHATDRSKGIADRRVELAKMQCFYNASGLRELGVGNTAYGVFNSLSEMNEHYLVSARTDPGTNILFGMGAERNRRIMKRLISM